MRLEPISVPDLVNNLCFNGYMCTINLRYNLSEEYKVQPYIIHLPGIYCSKESLNSKERGISAAGITLRGIITQGEILLFSLLLCRRAKRALGLLTIYGVR